VAEVTTSRGRRTEPRRCRPCRPSSWKAREIAIEKVGDTITKTAADRDVGTNDLLMSDLLRTNEL
jgi:hypothetical protein